MGYRARLEMDDRTLRDARVSPAPPSNSARWDHSVSYEDKRWDVIGSGASGVQITEALALAGCDVTQFIRRAQWVHIRENPDSTWRGRLRLRGTEHALELALFTGQSRDHD